MDTSTTRELCLALPTAAVSTAQCQHQVTSSLHSSTLMITAIRQRSLSRGLWSGLVLSTLAFLLPWQFSQFTLLTQVGIFHALSNPSFPSSLSPPLSEGVISFSCTQSSSHSISHFPPHTVCPLCELPSPSLSLSLCHVVPLPPAPSAGGLCREHNSSVWECDVVDVLPPLLSLGLCCKWEEPSPQLQVLCLCWGRSCVSW